MKKSLLCILGSLILLPFVAQAQEVDGLWLVPSKPGYNITAVDGPANDPDTALGVSILSPNFTTWGVFYGIKTGEVVADLIPSITNSDMRARWTTSGLSGTLQIQSCTRNCPFNAGETLDLVKVFGDGVFPPDPPAQGVTPGLWTGSGICFFVNDDGTQIVESDLCDDGKALSAEGIGAEVDFNGTLDPDACQANVVCGGAWAINYGEDVRASCINEAGGLGDFYFSSSTSAQVEAWDGLGGIRRACVTSLNATPTQ